MTNNAKLFHFSWKINETHIDHYGHVNNACYVATMEACAWAHSNALGISLTQFRDYNCAMVITHHNITYHHALHKNQTADCFTWIGSCPNRLRLRRHFIFFSRNSAQDSTKVLTAHTDFACITLDSGRPQKMPSALHEIYTSAVYPIEHPPSTLTQAFALSQASASVQDGTS